MASRFWVGGSGTWDAATTTHWASTSGGAGGASVPGGVDTVTFDGSSGGGTVTVNTTVFITSLTWGAFTGTIDFSVNNNNVTIQATFSGTGTGTRTFKMGSGTWWIVSASTQFNWNMTTITNLTFDAGTSTLRLTANVSGAHTFTPNASLTYATVQISAAISNATTVEIATNLVCGDFSAVSPNRILLSGTITASSFTLTGASGTSPVTLHSKTPLTTRSISLSSGSTIAIAWAALGDLACTGGATFTAQNSFNLGANSGVTITGPGGVKLQSYLNGGMQ